MLSERQRLQLGQTHRGTHTVPRTSTFISGKEGWLLFISLLILISLPQGRAWPYGKRLAKTLTPPLLFLSLRLARSLGLCSLFSKSRHQHSLHPPLYPLRAQRRTASLVKEDPQRDSDGKHRLLQRQLRKTALTGFCSRLLIQSLF